MRCVALTAVAIVCGFVPDASLFAQPVDPIAASLALNGNQGQQDDLRSMARCIVDRFPAAVQRAIRTQDPQQGFQNNQNVLIDRSCVPTRFFRRSQFMITSWYYSQLAEVLLMKDYSLGGLPDIGTVPALEHPALPEMDMSKVPMQYRSVLAVDRWHHKLDLVAECVDRAKSQSAFDLARSKPDSTEETNEFTKVRGAMDGCKASELAPAPPPSVLRAAMSENLYRLFDAARPVDHL